MNISKSKRNIFIVVLTIGILMIISVPIMQQYKSKKVMNLYFSSERWNQLKKHHSEHPILPNCVLLFGDSMTENFEKYISNPQLLNFGISGDFSSGLITRVNSVVKQQPQQIFIMIGINDIIEKVPVSAIKNNYMSVLHQLKEDCPNSEIYVQSTLPTREINSLFSSSKNTNDKVLELNTLMQMNCKELNISFIDLYPLFLDQEKLLKKELSLDGIHLTKQGYDLWKNELQKHLKFLLN